MERVENKKNTPFASRIYEVVRESENEIISEYGHVNESGNERFKSPLHQIKLVTWEEYAYRMKKNAVKGSPMQKLYHFLEMWYVALRMVVQTWEEEEQLVLQWLIINDGFRLEGWFGPKLESS